MSEAPLEAPEGYAKLSEDTVVAYVKTLPESVQAKLGSTDNLLVKEVGDGNLNFVFIITNKSDTSKAIVIKQSLPYVRCVGESWRLPLKRAYFEHSALVDHGTHAPAHVPAVYYYDEKMYTITMEFLTPHIILRKGLIARTIYPHIAEHMSTYLARTLFYTSDLYLQPPAKKMLIAKYCENWPMCELTEGVIFTDPYGENQFNRHTTPQLDDVVADIRRDASLKRAISFLKSKFIASPEALIHADLHTGSVMVTGEDTRVIDPEFAYFGPMGFDVGALVGNIFLSVYSQNGHAGSAEEISSYQDWLLAQVSAIWTQFRAKFDALWVNEGAGGIHSPKFYNDTAMFDEVRSEYFARLFTDTLGFAGAKMLRRIVGIAHVEDLDSIDDADVRGACEKRALAFARTLLINADSFSDIESVTKAIKASLP